MTSRGKDRVAIAVEGKAYYPACLPVCWKPSAAALTVVSVSGGGLRGWTLALWLAAPNRGLPDRAPAELIEDDQVSAARAAGMDGVPVE